MPTYITVPFDTDPETLIDEAIAFIQDRVDGWQPADGNLDYWLIQIMSSEAAELMDVASTVPDSIFRVFGSQLMGINPVEESHATAYTTWTVVDNQGYVIPNGTQVGIRSITSELMPFLTFTDVIIPPGNTTTAVGEVLIEAIEAGEASSGLGGIDVSIELLDPLAFVTDVSLTDVTSGGVDAEDDSTYLDRLTAKLTTMAPRPILPNDFSVLAREVPGIFRAVTIDGYNPAGAGTFNNERMVTVAAQDEAGANIPTTTKTDLANYLDGLREINFVVNVMDPKRTNVTVTYDLSVLQQFDPAAVLAGTQQSVTDFLSPVFWGAEPALGDPLRWDDTTTLRINELIATLDRTEGVRYVSNVKINGGTSNVTLASPASLPNLTSVVGTLI
jgi:uncharacterized phage protein gp47/JayE